MVTWTPEELVVHTPSLRLAARAWGPPDGLPVLATHGWLDNAGSFDRLAPLLVERAPFRVVALDWPGHGHSAHLPPGLSYHFIDLVHVMTAVADAFGWERFRLLAHSLGAAAGLIYLGALPDRVERAVMLEGLGPMTVEPEDGPDQLASALTDRTAIDPGGARVYGSIDEVVDRICAANLGRSREAARHLAQRGTEVIAGGMRFSHDRRLRARTPVRMTEAHVLAFLGRVRCPLLVVRADDGWPFPADRAQGRMRAIPGVRLLRVPGEHHVHLEHPERLVDPVVRFLSGEDAIGKRVDGGPPA